MATDRRSTSGDQVTPARFKVAHAATADGREAARRCAVGLGNTSGAELGFVYASDRLADAVPDIVNVLANETGIRQWVGSVGIGVSTLEEAFFDQPAVVAMAAPLAADDFRVFAVDGDNPSDLPNDVDRWLARTGAALAVVHADPNHPSMVEALDDFVDATDTFVVGGLTSSRAACPQVAGTAVIRGGLSGVLLAPGVTVATGLTQGCTPLGPRHIITESVDNILMTIDNRPALEVLKEDVGEAAAKDLSRLGGVIHAALPLAGSDTGDYLVRNLLGIDPGRGWLAIGDRVGIGDSILFVRRDPTAARADLRAMLTRLKGRLGAPPRGALYFSCVARGPNMFQRADGEVALIRETLGDVPLVGFACSGEISGGRIYGYTGVLAVFTAG